MGKTVDLPRDGETRLQVICGSIERWVMRSRQTVMEKKVNRFALTTMNSFQKGVESNRPLQVKELVEKTIDKYTLVWKKLMCYVVRMVMVEVDNAEALFQLTDRQREAFDNLLWETDEQISREKEKEREESDEAEAGQRRQEQQ